MSMAKSGFAPEITADRHMTASQARQAGVGQAFVVDGGSAASTGTDHGDRRSATSGWAGGSNVRYI